jgi:hypothetical protein
VIVHVPDIIPLRARLSDFAHVSMKWLVHDLETLLEQSFVNPSIVNAKLLRQVEKEVFERLVQNIDGLSQIIGDSQHRADRVEQVLDDLWFNVQGAT